MWSDSDGERELRPHEERPPAALTPTPAHAAAAAAAAASAAPRIAQLNVSKNSRMHIGPKFVSVTQTVQTTEVIKGCALGLRLEEGEGEGAGARRLRCSVAVCACWALAVAAALAFYACRLALAERPERLDLEVGAARYAWRWARRSSCAERVALVAALGALVLCGALAAALARGRTPPPAPDAAPHEWDIARDMWLAAPRSDDEEPWPARYVPLRLVVVQHTAGAECERFADCAAAMRNLQRYYFKEYDYDVPYNFVVGNDGRVYEGRGWEHVAAHTRGYNRCALGLGFFGDYRSMEGGSWPTAQQMNRTRLLLAEGVRRGVLHARHVLLAASDVQATASPGQRLVAALRTLPASPPDPAAYRDRSCDDIYDAADRLQPHLSR